VSRAAFASMAFLAAASVGAGCSSSDSGASTLTLSPVTWNPSNTNVGQVQAVAEYDKTVAVFGAQGVTAFVSGAAVGTDATVTSWTSSGVMPSADGLGMWLVGIDGDGRLRRVGSQAAIEDVSDRFGLASDKVQALAGDTGVTGFLLAQGLAVSDGKTVAHYDATTSHGVAAGAAQVAVAVDSGVRIFEPSKGDQETDVGLPDATFVAYDATGGLFAATNHALYKVEGGEAHAVYDAGGRTVHALAAAGSNIWVAVDGDLAVVQNGQVSVTSGAAFPPDAHLAGSPSGDIWLVAGGQLFRYAVQANAGGGGGDEATWSATVQPIYASVCSNCHSAPGSGKDTSNVDLSNYALWDAHRAKIYQRVVAQAGTPTSMPPSGSGFTLTEVQRAAIEAWSKP